MYLKSLWSYTREEVPYLAQTLMEISLAVPLLLALMPWTRYWSPWLFFFLLLAYMSLPFNLMRLMNVWGVGVNYQRPVLTLTSVFCLVISVKWLLYTQLSFLDRTWLVELLQHINNAGYPFWMRDFSLIIIVLFFWWRGVRLAARYADMEVVGLQFRVRSLILAPAAIFLSSSRLGWPSTPFIMLFCFASLLLIVLSRAEQVQADETGFSFNPSPQWLALVVGLNLAVVYAGGTIAAALSGEQTLAVPQQAVRMTFFMILYTLITLGGPTLFVVLDWLALLLQPIMAPIAYLMSEFELPEFLQPTSEQLLPTVEGDNPQENPLSYVPVFIALIILLLIIFVISYAIQKSWQSSKFARGRVSNRLVLQKPQPEVEGFWGNLRRAIPSWRNWQTAATIRRIYHQMVEVASTDGYPRREAETPYEYMQQLNRLWPGNTAEVALITQAYVQVRYGEIPEKADELQQIFDAWQKLEKIAEEKRLQ